MSRKKWAVKNNFADLVDFIRDLGDDDFKSHFNAMTKNATYMSHFTVDEFVKILSGYIETSFLRDLLICAYNDQGTIWKICMSQEIRNI